MLARTSPAGNVPILFLAEGMAVRPQARVAAHPSGRVGSLARKVSIDPDEISAARLPRTLLRGYKVKPTQELLRRIAWDYRQVAYEGKALATAAEEFTRRIAELEFHVRQLEASPEGTSADALADGVLAEARRIADELQAAARAECEMMLAEARARSRDIEAAALARLEAGTPGRERLDALRERLRAEICSTLDSLAALDPVLDAPSIDPLAVLPDDRAKRTG
jgi:cell division septum initiation protein DivIVA